MTRLKTCGLRGTEHVRAAVASGADFLGFVFVPGVRRQLSENAAKSLIAEHRADAPNGAPRVVGLFANQPLDEVNRIVETCGLDAVQLCGDEPPDYWRRVNASVIRQIKVRDDGERQEVSRNVLEQVEQVAAHGCLPLLDKHERGALGGTGRSFDWSVACEAAERHDLLLAGGLTPDNVGRAIQIASPWGVDVSSGIETDGVKDPIKIARFANAVRHADATMPPS